MISTISNSGHTVYGTREYVLDSTTDVENLPIDIPAGSVAFCIEDSSVYMLNSQGEWKEI